MWLAVLLTSALGYGRSSVMMDLERALDALKKSEMRNARSSELMRELADVDVSRELVDDIAVGVGESLLFWPTLLAQRLGTGDELDHGNRQVYGECSFGSYDCGLGGDCGPCSTCAAGCCYRDKGKCQIPGLEYCCEPWCYAATSTVFVQGEGGIEARALANAIPGKTRLLSRDSEGRLYFDDLDYIRHNGKYTSLAGPLKSTDLLEVIFDLEGERGSIVLSTDHQVRLADRNMKSAEDLIVGDLILTANGVGRFVRTAPYQAETQVLTPVTKNDEFLIAGPGSTNFTYAVVGTFQDTGTSTPFLLATRRIFGGNLWVGSSRRAFCSLKQDIDDCWALDEYIAELWTRDASYLLKGLLIVVDLFFVIPINYLVIYGKEATTFLTLIFAFRTISRRM